MSESRAYDMTTAYYDRHADGYDEVRGGLERAAAAAEAIVALAPGKGLPDRGRCLDVAGGTGTVSAALAARGWSVTVADLSAGMIRLAAERLPGRAIRASADRLPVADATIDLVTVIWMLNLIPTSLVETVITEAARALAPGGHLVVTVDKELAHDASATDLTDGDERVTAIAATVGLERDGTTTFSGRSPWGSATDGDPVFRLAAFRRL
ncbi:MAG: class I SAM-dependent methyltransferase [Propionibacteriaceae bacterium]